ncbi:MAG TPA: aminotransferase class V-fold PLP-dependent enzyme [Candidatus Polarisedimenticolia bacterium]|nr:aminotransferase class V-fold PLP-dependent enzyme [Candidatus Polarisedimenticolia bacterium]
MTHPETSRQAFDLHPEAVYLNAASEGPIPRRAMEALRQILDRKIHPFRLGGEEYFQVPQRTRDLCAELVGCRSEEIVLTSSTGAGINLAAAGLPLEQGDEVLLLKGDFPALVNPFLHARRRGIVTVEVTPAGRVPALEDFERAMTPRTRVLALSHVLPTHGFQNDLPAIGRLCRDRGVTLVVDAAQSAGVLPIPFEEAGVGVLAAPGHKWLLGFPGTGFAAIRSEVMERMVPPAVGWMGCLSNTAQFISMPAFDLSLFRGGKKFEVGTTPYPQLAAWNASLELILERGVAAIAEHVSALLDPLWGYFERSPYKLLSSPDPAHRSAIFSFTGKFAAKLYLLLNERKIFPGLRSGAIRVSPHLYNTVGDIERLLEALRELEGAKLEADRKGENL